MCWPNGRVTVEPHPGAADGRVKCWPYTCVGRMVESCRAVINGGSDGQVHVVMFRFSGLNIAIHSETRVNQKPTVMVPPPFESLHAAACNFFAPAVCVTRFRFDSAEVTSRTIVRLYRTRQQQIENMQGRAVPALLKQVYNALHLAVVATDLKFQYLVYRCHVISCFSVCRCETASCRCLGGWVSV